MGTQVEVPQTAQIARRLSFSSNETQHITAYLSRFTAAPEKCYEIERQLLSLKERLRPLKFKLRHTLAKRLVCERVLAGGLEGYETIVVAPETMEQSQENLKALREDKRALREANAVLTREIGELIERILGSQHNLQETLQELASFGEDSPYVPAQAVSHFQAPTASEEEDEKTLKLAISKLESRVSEIEEYQTATTQVHGFYLEDYSAHHATFTFDLERIASEYLKTPEAVQEFLSQCSQSSEPLPFQVKLNWTLGWELLSAETPYLTESFEDIFDLAVEDNSPSFCLREVSRRLHCFAKRFHDIGALNDLHESAALTSRAFDSVLGFTFTPPSGATSWTFGISVPSEYPHLGVSVLHITPSEGAPIDCTAFRNQRFSTISEGFEAAVRAISE